MSQDTVNNVTNINVVKEKKGLGAWWNKVTTNKAYRAKLLKWVGFIVVGAATAGGAAVLLRGKNDDIELTENQCQTLADGINDAVMDALTGSQE